MKALVKYSASSDLRVDEVEEPTAGPDDVKIEVKAAGICGTDLHIRKNEYKHAIPVVLGHEYSGVVVEAGANAGNWAVGDRVVSLTAAVTCGTCEFCLAGIPMLCSERKSIGSGVNGAFAKRLVVPARLVKKVPDSVGFDEAAVTEPLACVVHGVMEMSEIAAGDVVLVSGPGVIGLLALQIAKASGAKVIVSGASGDAGRLQIAKAVGASEIVDVSSGSIDECVNDLTRGRGVDAAIECSGAAASFTTCMRLLRKRWRHIQMALFGKPLNVDLDAVTYKEIRYSCSYASTHSSFDTALRLLESGLVDVGPLISARFPLEEWRQGFEMMDSKKGIKVLFIPD